MKRNTLLLVGIGSIGALLVLGRRRGASGSPLTSPIEGSGPPKVTPHGHFGASRAGPPKHSHQGIDLAARPGSHVLAIGDGVIVPTDPGIGKIVRKLKLDAPAPYGFGQRPISFVVYADLGTPLVNPGDRVQKGQPIALVDKAGFVHFAVKEQRSDGREAFFDPKEAGFAYRLSGPEVA